MLLDLFILDFYSLKLISVTNSNKINFINRTNSNTAAVSKAISDCKKAFNQIPGWLSENVKNVIVEFESDIFENGEYMAYTDGPFDGGYSDIYINISPDLVAIYSDPDSGGTYYEVALHESAHAYDCRMAYLKGYPNLFWSINQSKWINLTNKYCGEVMETMGVICDKHSNSDQYEFFATAVEKYFNKEYLPKEVSDYIKNLPKPSSLESKPSNSKPTPDPKPPEPKPTPASNTIIIAGQTIPINATFLDLSGKALTDITPLKSLTNLKVLNLDDNQIKDITPLESLIKLEDLSLCGNKITDVTPLKSLTNLTNLYLIGDQIKDITPLKSLTKLKNLNLWANYITDITAIKSLKNLEILNIGDNQIRDITALKSLTNLRELWMNYNQISNLTPLKSLTKLQTVALNDNNLTKAQIQELRKALPGCKITETR